MLLWCDSNYSAEDSAAAAGGAKVDEERDRRLEVDEEARIRAVLDGGKREDRERSFEQHEQAVLVLLFDLALETAVRMRERFTLDVRQAVLAKRTIFLEKCNNDGSGQVKKGPPPVTSHRGDRAARRTGVSALCSRPMRRIRLSSSLRRRTVVSG